MHLDENNCFNKFAVSNHTALILGVHALRSYLKLIYKYELHSLPNKKVSGAKDHGKSYIKVRPPLVAIFCIIVYCGQLFLTNRLQKMPSTSKDNLFLGSLSP